ncbi:MAG: hypothetical protein J0H94_03980 [Rhizobiales bacterium]|nr:hypothetical protein [Hyphomicrobiales bacterium]
MDNQLPLALPAGGLSRQVVDEAGRRGLKVEPTLIFDDVRLVGEIGGLLGALNHVLERAAIAGIEVSVLAHYSDIDRRRRRCIVTGRVKRIAYDVRV